MTLYPSILTGSIEEAKLQASLVSSFGKVEAVQVDIIDGLFVDNVTITPTDLIEIDFAELNIDLHLMTEEPLDYVYETMEYKDIMPIRAMISQVERMSNQADYVEIVKKNSWKVGLSLDLHTPFEAIEEASWQELDVVQLMAIEAGYQGQKFQESVLEKIKTLVVLRQKLDRKIEIIIDGGVKPNVVEQIIDAGADGVAVGSGLWKSDDLAEAVELYTRD
jgi:ribulose-phosphate 3-epimerase